SVVVALAPVRQSCPYGTSESVCRVRPRRCGWPKSTLMPRAGAPSGGFISVIAEVPRPLGAKRAASCAVTGRAIAPRAREGNRCRIVGPRFGLQGRYHPGSGGNVYVVLRGSSSRHRVTERHRPPEDTMATETQEAIHGYVTDMLALEEHIEKAIQAQV